MNKYSGLFNENMSIIEAQFEFFQAIDRVDPSEKKELLDAFIPVSNAITRREHEENRIRCGI